MKNAADRLLARAAQQQLPSHDRKKLRKNRPQAAEADETVCPTIGSKRLALVAQALSPAVFDFFTASKRVVHFGVCVLWLCCLPAAAQSPYYQMVSPGHLKNLQQAGLTAAETQYFFNTPKTIFNMGSNGKGLTSEQIASTHSLYPHAGMNYNFNSFGPNTLTGAPGIQAIFAPSSTLIPQGLNSVSYDPEGPHNGTPANETAALEAGDTSFIRQAAVLVHAHGLKFFLIGSVDAGMKPEEKKFPQKYKTWLAQHRGAWAGIPGVDLYSIQSQQAEGTPTFAPFVAAAVAQAKAAAPKTPIDIGIGINPHYPPTVITAAIIREGYDHGVSAGAAGFWHNVEHDVNANVPLTVYVEFFHKLYRDETGKAP
jgi:hypothetical protein